MDANSKHLLQTLFEPTRWRIFETLRENGAMPPIAIAQEVDVSQQKLQYHLKLLMQCGIVNRGAVAKNLTYYVADTKLVCKVLEDALAYYTERIL